MTTTPKPTTRAAGDPKAKPAARPAAKTAAATPATAKPATAKPAATKPAATKPAAAKAAPKPKAAAAKPAPKPRAAPKPATQVVAEAGILPALGVVAEALSIRKKELVERVVAASGAKKKQVKEIVEHTLKVLGEALAKGEELNLPPFGKAKVNRSRDNDGGTTMMVKLKQGGDQAAARKAARKSAKQTLADGQD